MGSAAILVGGGTEGSAGGVVAGAERGGSAGAGWDGAGAGRGAGCACAGLGAGGAGGDGGTGSVAIGLGSGAERALSFGGSNTMATEAGNTSSGSFREGHISRGPTISSASTRAWTSTEIAAGRRTRTGRGLRCGRNSPTKAIGCGAEAGSGG